MNRRSALAVLVCILSTLPLFAAPQDEKPFDRKIDVVYGQAKGQDLCMDIFVPNGKARREFYKPNDDGKGYAIIDVISGGWNGSRARMNEHEAAQVFNIYCARYYTVFAIRCGSTPDFTGFEMVDNLKRGIRYVKAHAAEYGFDPNRIGLMGASAGGHLSCMTALTPEPGDPNAADPLLRWGTDVKAVSVLFPPTDFLHWKNNEPADINLEPYLMFSDGPAGKSQDEILAKMREISPIYLVKGKTPPFLLIHGDADPIVPLAQSQMMVERLKEAGNRAELIVEPGGGHFWLTLPEEIIQAADWFAARLRE